MDPYLEAPDLWPDVHLTLIIAMRAVLNASMPPGYAASADRYVWIHEPEATERTRAIRPDVDIVKEQETGIGGDRNDDLGAAHGGFACCSTRRKQVSQDRRFAVQTSGHRYRAAESG